MPQTLQYLPLTFRRHEPLWPACAACGAIAAGIAGTLLVLHQPLASWIVIPMLAFAGMCGALAVFAWSFDIASECRVEGGTLSYRSGFDASATHVQISDIEQIAGVSFEEGRWCELALRDGRRVRVNGGCLVFVSQNVFGARTVHERFAKAIRAVNPHVQFVQRDGGTCYACGCVMKVLHFPEGRCSECGAAKPTTSWNLQDGRTS